VGTAEGEQSFPSAAEDRCSLMVHHFRLGTSIRKGVCTYHLCYWFRWQLLLSKDLSSSMLGWEGKAYKDSGGRGKETGGMIGSTPNFPLFCPSSGRGRRGPWRCENTTQDSSSSSDALGDKPISLNEKRMEKWEGKGREHHCYPATFTSRKKRVDKVKTRNVYNYSALQRQRDKDGSQRRGRSFRRGPSPCKEKGWPVGNPACLH